MISPKAWGDLNFITEPQCKRCGLPFEFDVEEVKEGHLCGVCLKDPPIFETARASLVYDDASRGMILSFKHADQTHSVASFVPWLTQAGAGMLGKADYIVPVPLHRWRILRRRFNQAGLMAKYLSKHTTVPCFLGALQRVRPTVTQGHLRANERHKNVKNAFCVNRKRQAAVRGKNIILIDDVYTTGATVKECARVLLKAGALSVNILTLARVVKPTRV